MNTQPINIDTLAHIVYALICGFVVGIILLLVIAYHTMGDPVLLPDEGSVDNSDKPGFISIDEMSPEFLTVLIVAADPGYNSYRGISPFYILRTESNLMFGTRPQSVSITERIVEKQFLQNKQGLRRKIYKWAAAYRVERNYNEADVVSAYANMLNVFGEYSLTEAAGLLYSKTLNELDYLESTVLLSLNKEMDRIDIKNLYQKVNYILNVLHENNFITGTEYEHYRSKKGRLIDHVEYVISFLSSDRSQTQTRGMRYGALRYRDEIFAAADRWGVDRNLMLAVVQAESAGNPQAISHKGARGLGQVMLTTARSLRPDQTILRMDLYDVHTNLDISAEYLSIIQKRVSDNFPDAGLETRTKLIAASYNAGWSRVLRAKDVPRIRETQIYVQRVWDLYNIFRWNDRSTWYANAGN